MARKRKELLSLVGRTEDGKDVVTGVYRLYETEGVPLDVLKSKDVISDWGALVQEAEAAGMSRERFLSMLDPAIADSWGPGFRDVVVRRLRDQEGI